MFFLCFLEVLLLLIRFVCVQSRSDFQKLVSEESMSDYIVTDIQIGAL